MGSYPPETVWVAVGSNTGDRERFIRDAVSLLEAHPAISGVTASRLFETEPVGMSDNSGPFLNGVIRLQTTMLPMEFWRLCCDIETSMGRTNKGTYTARPIDLDIIFFGTRKIQTEQLTVPHPAYRQRKFVWEPILDLDPDALDPITAEPIHGLRND